MDQLLPTTNFNIDTAVYSGPFELVIGLIEKRKLLVNDLALAAVTDEFITHVRAQAEFPIEQTTNFISSNLWGAPAASNPPAGAGRGRIRYQLITSVKSAQEQLLQLVGL